MTPPRAPMDPPDLAGYDHVGLLGSGGFSDVFLYERRFPRQKVAIKVLVPGALGDAGEARFNDEANLMASLSTHPYIVTVYEAAISPDGLPYLVMEYYPRPNFLVRARSERFPVAAVLRVGVQVAAAVETAHRNGVIHRDIKPPNILTSEYGRPGLTDFGLAVGGDDRAGEAEGLSIPWSPPEVVAGVSDADVRSDVYSLAATLWTLLSGGRSPFEKAGANKGIDLIDRIERSPAPPVDRADVPASLQRLLAQAMAKDPRHRPATTAELARALQVIEVEQRFDMTPFEVSDDQPTTAGGGAIELDAAPTRVKNVAVIESQPATVAGDGTGPPAPREMIEAPAALRPVSAAPRSTPEVISSTPYRREAAAADGDGVPAPPPAPVRAAQDRQVGPVASTYRAPAGSSAPAGSPRRPGTAVVVAAGLAALLLLVAVVVAVVVVTDRDDDPGPTTSSTTVPGSEAAPLGPPTNVRVERLGEGRFQALWDAPSGMDAGDSFELTIDGEPAGAPFNRTTFEFSSERSSPCVVITAVSDGVPSAPASNRGGC